MFDAEAEAWEDALLDLAAQERKQAADEAFLKGNIAPTAQPSFNERFKWG